MKIKNKKSIFPLAINKYFFLFLPLFFIITMRFKASVNNPIGLHSNENKKTTFFFPLKCNKIMYRNLSNIRKDWTYSDHVHFSRYC